MLTANIKYAVVKGGKRDGVFLRKAVFDHYGKRKKLNPTNTAKKIEKGTVLIK